MITKKVTKLINAISQATKIYFFEFKVIIYDPTHPRKNITISITGVPEIIEKTKKALIDKIQNE